MKSKPRIYIDTSVISYLTARPSRDALQRQRQLVTKIWWERFRQNGEMVVSDYVIDEAELGAPEAVTRRLGVINGLHRLRPEIHTAKLAEHLIQMLGLPERSAMDGYHLAIAAWNGLHYIVSWNFKHMANAHIRRTYRAICQDQGLSAPEITTPEEMLGEEAAP